MFYGQLNEVKERLVEEQIESVVKLPNFLMNSIKDGRTSLGKHPSFPPEDEKRFEEKILIRRFVELGKSLSKINDLQQHDKQTLTNKLSEYVKKAIIIETPLRKELEKLCFSLKSSISCGLFSLKKQHLDLMNDKLNFYFEQIENYKLEDYKLENNDEKKLELKNNFLLKCEEFINEINKICKEIENELVIKDIGLNSDFANEIINKDNMDGTDIEALLKGYEN